MVNTTISTTDAREQLPELINRVAHNKERIALTRRGKEIAAIVPWSDLVSLLETQHKSDLNEAVEALKQAREQGSTSLDDLKKQLG